MKAIRVANWERFEKSDHKKCSVMHWIATPNSHDGIGFLTLLTLPDGLRKYGGWHLILQIASKCPTRGLLVSDSGRCIGAKEIALKTRSNEKDISDSIAACLSIGWLEHLEVSGNSPEDSGNSPEDSGDPQEFSGLQNRTEQDRTGQDNSAASAETAPAKKKRDTSPETALVNKHSFRLKGPRAEKRAAILELIRQLGIETADLVLSDISGVWASDLIAHAQAEAERLAGPTKEQLEQWEKVQKIVEQAKLDGTL